MIEVARLLSFLIFIAIGVSIAAVRQSRRRRLLINLLIAYVLLIHAALVITSRDDWPFTAYRLIEKTSHGDEIYQKISFYGVDSVGREWQVDPDAWSPSSPPALMQWFVGIFPHLPDAERRRATLFLLEKAERSRAARISGQRRPRQRWLAGLAAPDWWVYTRPVAVQQPFIALHIYREEFRPRDRVAGKPLLSRVLIASSP